MGQVSQNSTHLLGLVCSFWLSVYLSFSQNTSLHLDKHAWHLFWNAASMYQCMDVPLTPEIGCLFIWCARQWKFLINQTYFPHSSNRVRMSCVWKQNCVAVEWETDKSTFTHVVSLSDLKGWFERLVTCIFKLGHDDTSQMTGQVAFSSFQWRSHYKMIQFPLQKTCTNILPNCAALEKFRYFEIMLQSSKVYKVESNRHKVHITVNIKSLVFYLNNLINLTTILKSI